MVVGAAVVVVVVVVGAAVVVVVVVVVVVGATPAMVIWKISGADVPEAFVAVTVPV